jgi:hypothetical protein
VAVIGAGGTFTAASLMRFDGIDQELPLGAVVNSATLEFNVSWECCGDATFDVYQALQDWPVSDDAYWLNWGNGGTDPGYSAASTMGSTPKLGTGVHAISLDPAVVQDWVDNPGTNFGMVIRAGNIIGQPHMAIEEYNAGTPPSLTIDYIPEPASLALLGLGALLLRRWRR